MTKKQFYTIISQGTEYLLSCMTDSLISHDAILGQIVGHMNVWYDTLYIALTDYHGRLEARTFIEYVYEELADMVIYTECRLAV